jgi:hypothetical protein
MNVDSRVAEEITDPTSPIFAQSMGFFCIAIPATLDVAIV